MPRKRYQWPNVEDSDVLEQDQQRRAERAADQRSDAADDHRDQHVAGDEPAHQVRRDEIDVLHFECAGERGDRRQMP